MRTLTRLLLPCVLLVGSGTFSAFAEDEETHGEVPRAVEVPEAIREFLQFNCLDCHEGEYAEAGFDVTSLEAGLGEENLDRWVRVFDRVHDGEMPPPDASTLEPEETAAFVRQSGDWLRAYQRRQQQRLGRVRARRLTNLQLERSLQHVLGIDVPLSRELPDEPRSDGFTTVAEAQSVSHFQLQQHLDVVDMALEEAFRRAIDGDDLASQRREMSAQDVARTNPRRRTREPEMLDGAAVVWSSGLSFYGRLPATTAKQSGWYRFEVEASALKKPDDHGVWCSVRSGRCVSSAPLYEWVGMFAAQNEPQRWTFETWLDQGQMLEIRPNDRTLKQARFAGGQVGAGEGEPQNVPGVALHEVVMQRFHRGADDDAIRRILFDDLPLEVSAKPNAKRRGRAADRDVEVTLDSDDPAADIARLMHRFAGRAFRRPVELASIAHYVDATTQAVEDGQPLVEALRDGYRALLCSPRFMYYYEPPGELDDAAIATRLSYFLTGGPPDAVLLQLAAEDRLSDADVLEQQVERLLEQHDSRFIRDFANQWLDLSEINFTEPDRRLFRRFDILVQQSMLAETEMFLTDMLRRDASTAQLIDSPHTFLNERLARYYGIDGVTGDRWQRVELRPEDHRGGVLTQGAILKITANGTNTSPVIRGVWVSERLLGVPIAPPPESIPAIEPDTRGATTIRQLLEKHLSDDSCASCHVKIDPPGFALENYDPAGQWRTHYRRGGRSNKQGAKIDPGYEWPDGTSFADINQFRQRVLEDRRRIAANVAEKMIAYGTGAPASFADRPALEQIVASTQESDYGFRSLLKAVVTSELFRRK